MDPKEPGKEADAATKPAGSTRAPGRPPTHGLKTMRRALAKLGTGRLDRRSAIAQAARRFKEDLVRDLGGDPSAQQLAVIELAARTWIMLSALDDWLMRQPSLINARKKAVLPALRERQQLADSLARYMSQLGLERRTRESDVGALMAVLQGKAG